MSLETRTDQHWHRVTSPPSADSVLSAQTHISIGCSMKSLNADSPHQAYLKVD